MKDNKGCLQNKKKWPLRDFIKVNNGLFLITKYNLNLPEEKKFEFLPMYKHMVYQRPPEQLIL